jgi:hypothetical protein
VGLAQLVRFLVVKLTHPSSNPRFDSVLHLQLIILSVGGDVPVDSKTLLVIDFVNLRIKSAQSFRCAYRGRGCVRVFIGVSAHTCMSICVCTVFLKKNCNPFNAIVTKFQSLPCHCDM